MALDAVDLKTLAMEMAAAMPPPMLPRPIKAMRVLETSVFKTISPARTRRVRVIRDHRLGAGTSRRRRSHQPSAGSWVARTSRAMTTLIYFGFRNL